jgi:hypothetical protein
MLSLHSHAVGETSVWIYIRCWPPGFHVRIHVTEPHVGDRHRRISRRIGAGLLSTSHGWRGCRERNDDTRVRRFLLLTAVSHIVVLRSGLLGSVLSTVSIAWCTYAASGIFVAVLRMSDQRLLVAYPVGLLYGCFALLSVFHVGGRK